MRVDVVETVQGKELEVWRARPVYWSAVWVGALAGVALAMVFGLVSLAVGTHEHGTGKNSKRVGRLAAHCGVCSLWSFSFGGAWRWVAGKIIDIQRAEPATLHGVIAWLLAVPLTFSLVSLGAGTRLAAGAAA